MEDNEKVTLTWADSALPKDAAAGEKLAEEAEEAAAKIAEAAAEQAEKPLSEANAAEQSVEEPAAGEKTKEEAADESTDADAAEGAGAEETAYGEDGKAGTKKKKRMSKKRRAVTGLLALVLLAIIAAAAYFGTLAFSVKNSDSPVGYWVIKEGTSGDVTMTQQDAEAIGLNEVGSVRLDKSGDCRVTILNEESEGTWTRDDDGTITINFGDDKTLTATIDEEGVMTAKDANITEYILEK